MQVKKMECDVCKVQTEKGDCVLQSVKVGGGRKTTTASIKTRHKQLNYWIVFFIAVSRVTKLRSSLTEDILQVWGPSTAMWTSACVETV